MIPSQPRAGHAPCGLSPAFAIQKYLQGVDAQAPAAGVALWGEAGPAPAGHSQFQPDIAGSRWTQPVPGGSNCPLQSWGHSQTRAASREQIQERAKHDTEDFEETVDKRNNAMDPKVRTEGEGDAASGPGAEIPLQPVERTMLEQIFTSEFCWFWVR